MLIQASWNSPPRLARAPSTVKVGAQVRMRSGENMRHAHRSSCGSWRPR
jgi:hypothetical protein